MDTQAAYLLAISFYLTLPSCQGQDTHSGSWKHAQPPGIQTDHGARPPASLPIQDRYDDEDGAYMIPQQQYAHMGKDNKLSVFIAAAVGTMTLMGVVYCIYSQFYSKKLFSHTQLEDDAELMLDVPESSSSYFSSCPAMMDGKKKTSQTGYGSISDPPSIINIPPALQTTPPLATPFNPFSLSTSTPLQTISAQNLERSFV